MLVVRILDVSDNDTGCSNQDELFKTGVEVDRVNDLARVADAMIKFNLLII